MKVAEEAKCPLATGLSAIAAENRLPASFPTPVMEAASRAVELGKSIIADHSESQRQDATRIEFVTLDPASSTDLDQAFAIEKDGDEIVLHYALADVGAFVPQDGVVETEAWKRGVTIYGLAEKVPLYPPSISQNAGSLLPNGPRPAILVVVAISATGEVRLRNIGPAICQSRAKLAYDSFDVNSVPYLEEFAKRFWLDETARGAVRVEFPQQEVVGDDSAPGGVRLELRARNYAESVNSTLSLAVNIAIGSMLREAKVGLFRVMDDPEPKAISQLRRAAHALAIPWKTKETLRDLHSRLDPLNVTHQRFLLLARRSGTRAEYAVFDENKPPWHAAIASTYAHATAPLRRLADRYVLDLACMTFNQQPIPMGLIDRLNRLPLVMRQCEDRAGNVERSVIDLLEAVSLQDRIGEILVAEVVDAKNGIVQTTDSAIRSKALNLTDVKDGEVVRVRIDEANPTSRRVRLSFVGRLVDGQAAY